MPSAPDLLDQVVYPNDFPTGPNKSNLPTSGLLLPDSHKAMPPKYVKVQFRFLSSFQIFSNFLQAIIRSHTKTNCQLWVVDGGISTANIGSARHYVQVSGAGQQKYREQCGNVWHFGRSIGTKSSEYYACDSAEAKWYARQLHYHERRGDFRHSRSTKSHHAGMDSCKFLVRYIFAVSANVINTFLNCRHIQVKRHFCHRSTSTHIVRIK